jgi:hypothetical protein
MNEAKNKSLVNFTGGYKPDPKFTYKLFIDGDEEAEYHSLEQVSAIIKNKKKIKGIAKKFKITKHPRDKLAGPLGKLPEEVAENSVSGKGKPTSLNDNKSPCWVGYKKVGMKMKGGKSVNNCVPVDEDEEVAANSVAGGGVDMNTTGMSNAKMRKMYNKKDGIKSLKKFIEDEKEYKESVEESSMYDDKANRADRNRERNYGVEDEANPNDKGRFNLAIDGKVVNDRSGKPIEFSSKASLTKATLTMMKKPFNKGKKFTSLRLK